VLLAAVGYMGLVVLLIAVSWSTEARATSRVAAWLGAQTRLEGHCSFCTRSYRKAGPLADGPSRIYICEHCVLSCGDLIAAEKM
jgi:ClpX C4-type zinc finger